uniref:Uncharacterized protein n=1 Tax=Aureoumbra lagunensis TaxID=44058 RepID=A0A7S3JQ05_9STRA|mmetsp:Transcript_3376/g.4712  ORF Transcript_3376/g.4712 Transcript_3376/m.4712 type:complete len:237 (-) Transcript_3376:260-970(-)
MARVIIALIVNYGAMGFVVPQQSSYQCKDVCGHPNLIRRYAYVPDGLSAEQWKKMKAKEETERKKKNFGKGGARGFESRSMNSFVAALEKGEAKHLMPVNPQKVKEGKIALKDVPYMQRGGSWDNKDLTGKRGWMNTGFGMKAFNDGKAQKMKKNKYDDKYNKLKPSTNMWGTSVGTDWTGKQDESLAKRAKKNGISNDMQMWRDAGALSPEEARKRRGGAPKLNDKTEKKFFGLF